MKKALAILPISIGGRLTTQSIIDGFIENNIEVVIFDELKNKSLQNFLNEKYDYLVGYDFSPIKIKVDYNLDIPTIAYFSDVIESKTSGEGYIDYYKYLSKDDIYVFYWDRILAEKDNYHYMPHFVNTKVYKNIQSPEFDVLFAGRLDTDYRLRTFIELNKKLPDVEFKWCAIQKHYIDALNRSTDEEKNIIKKAYYGFIDNEQDMAKTINKAKIVYNINAQGISSLNYRTMQTIACERLLISDNRKELDLFENIIPTWDNIDDLAGKIKYYLENSTEYYNIVKKSRKIVELNHDSFKNVKNMLEIID